MALNSPKSKPSEKSATGRRKARSSAVVKEEKTHGGAFFAIQQPLIHLIEEYLLTHLVSGKKMTLKTFCERSGMTVANMTGIVNGNRWVAKCSRETIEKLASVLEIPILQLYVLSGFITTADVIYSTNIDETVSAIFRKMSKDKRMSFRVPSEDVWNTWPMSAKLSLCMMYEQMIEKVLFRYANLESADAEASPEAGSESASA